MTKLKRTTYILAATIIIAGLVVGYGGWAYARTIPSISATQTASVGVPAKPVSIPWPSYGQAALVSSGSPLITSGGQTPAPMASIAKVVTALAVIKAKPLALGQQGPTLTLGDTDVNFYQYYLNNDGSVAKVVSGEQISEYQALQAMLLPSANNMADSLANWAYGSVDQYASAANTMLAQMNITHTKISDASGFSADTTSTATDLVTIGQALLADPVLSQIVAQPSANIPVAGTINNINSLLGTDGMIGIKTGNTDQAGGCFLFAGQKDIAPGQSVKVVGAILGAPNLGTAMRDSLPLLNATYNGFSYSTIISKGTTFGNYSTPWGSSSKAVATQEVKLLRWQDTPVTLTLKLDKLRAPTSSGKTVGSATAAYGTTKLSSPIVLQSTITAPNLVWRIKR